MVSATPALGEIIRSWALVSLRPTPFADGELVHGTLLLRTSGDWDSVVAVAIYNGEVLTPAVLFKNPVPLWQLPRPVPNGGIEASSWGLLRRAILIHNPGLTGLLADLDAVMTTNR